MKTRPVQETPVRSKENFLVFGAPAIEEEEILEVVDSLRSGWLGTGPKVARFERDFASYKQAPHAVAVSSCTAALHLALLASGLEPGDEVITTPLDILRDGQRRDPARRRHAGACRRQPGHDEHRPAVRRSSRGSRGGPSAIVPVHFGGPARATSKPSIAAIAGERHDLKIIEDCAHAIETRVNVRRRAGTIGDFGCFSFYVTKNVATGEGGHGPGTERRGRRGPHQGRSRCTA